jgi:peroxiredoxin/uncharacterized membrane protein
MLAFALFLARLALATVFGVAGITKLLDSPGTRRSLVQFGVPDRLGAVPASVLPVAELCVALALLLFASGRAGGIGAFCLLLLFSGAISVNLARGRTPDCHCFGQLHSSPIGWGILARNLCLAALAAPIVWQGRNGSTSTAFAWLKGLRTVQLVNLAAFVSGIALLVAGIGLLLQILRQQGRLLLRIEAIENRLAQGGDPVSGNTSGQWTPGLPLGAAAPDFVLNNLRGEPTSLSTLLIPRKPLLVFFTNPACVPCQALMPEVTRWQREYGPKLTLALISEGTVEENDAKIAAHGVTLVLLQRKREIAEAYGTYGTPSAVLVRPDSMIGSPMAQGADAIRELVAKVVGAQTSANGLALAAPHDGSQRTGGNQTPPPRIAKIGEPAPPLRFQDLAGRTRTLASFYGSKTLLLFWNPECGFCQQMLGDLRTLEADQPPVGFRILVISTGTAGANRAMNLRSLILLDKGARAGALFGAHGTPMALLLDAQGRVASGVAVGAQDVVALARLHLHQTA